MAYTEQRTLKAKHENFGLLMVKANGGSVDVEFEFDGSWLVVETIDTDGAYELDGKNVPVRISPTGGASWELVR